MQLGILVCDSNGAVKLTNKPLECILGFTEAELLLSNAKDFFSTDSIFHDFLMNYNDEKYHQQHETIGIRKDGSAFAAEIIMSTVTFEGVIYLKLLLSDITVRKQKEKEMAEIKETLEQAVQQQTKELESAVDKLKKSLNREKELNTLKTKFIALASHEFKTPLSAILTSSELIVKYADLQQHKKRDEHASKIKTMIHHLNGMLDDMLTLENIETGKIVPDYSFFRLNALINKVMQTSKSFLRPEQELVFNNGSDELIYQDPKIIQIILSNLLNNAIKYSGEKGKIKVGVELTNDRIVFSVEDNGLGIPQNEQGLIFKRFFRASNVVHQPGTGIGLNIVIGYVQGLGGTINYESVENEYSKFYVQLPKIVHYE
jgi:PAS domain S-box-containing protein